MIPFVQLCKLLQEKIAAGALQQTLPSIRELSLQYKIGGSTVKRALNRLKEMGYIEGLQGKCVRINPNAQNNLLFHRNIVIFTTLNKLIQHYYTELVRIISQKLSQQYALVHIMSSLEQLENCGFIPDALIVLEATDNEEFEKLTKKVPKERIIRVNFDSAGCLCMQTDNFRAGEMAIEYLHGRMGHTQIGIIGYELQCSYSYSHLRCDGALAAASRYPGVHLEIVNTVDFAESDAAFRELMSRNPKITAIFATMDMLTLGVYHECSRQKLSIPEDISVLGFDNRDFSPFMTPSLTTFQEDAKEGGRILEEYIERILNEQFAPVSQSLPPALVVRESICVLDGKKK